MWNRIPKRNSGDRPGHAFLESRVYLSHSSIHDPIHLLWGGFLRSVCVSCSRSRLLVYFLSFSACRVLVPRRADRVRGSSLARPDDQRDPSYRRRQRTNRNHHSAVLVPFSSPDRYREPRPLLVLSRRFIDNDVRHQHGYSRCFTTTALQPVTGSIISHAAAAVYATGAFGDSCILVAGASDDLERGAMGISHPR